MIEHKDRIHLIDTLRGLAIILMVIQHFAIDLCMFGWLSWEVVDSIPVTILHYIFGSLFVLISGVCCHFTHSNIKRGIITLSLAFAVSVGTYIVDPTCYVRFGILHFFGTAMLVYGVGRKFFDMLSRRLMTVVYAILFGAGWFVIAKPVQTTFLWMFGFCAPGFCSSDYWPIIPWIFLFLLGACIGGPIKEHRFPEYFYSCKENILSKVGRHTMIIYIAHQPILYGICLLIYNFCH